VTRLILASTSPTRRALLAAAGVAVGVVSPAVDEAAIKLSLAAADAAEVAERLAAEKAVRVAEAYPDALVIGADQMLDCAGAWFDKPTDRASARAQLVTLRGRSHRLITAAAVAQADSVVWRHRETATLTMRPFSDAFLDAYLDRVGDAALSTVGAYCLEGLGAQLFTEVSGDHFVILGLPLLPLLSYLRRREVIDT
jgi:septum formation protein